MSFRSRDPASATKDETGSDLGRNSEPGTPSLTALTRINNIISTFESTFTRHFPGMGQPGPSRAPISPPPLKRPFAEVVMGAGPPSVSTGTSSVTEAQPESEMTKDTTPVPSTTSDGGGFSGSGPGSGSQAIVVTSRQGTPRRQTSTPTLSKTFTPKSQTRMGSDWTFDNIVERLETFHQDVKAGHAQLAGYIIESTKAPERRTHHGADLFAKVCAETVPEKRPESMKIRFKQHLKTKKDLKEEHHLVSCIKTNKERVPSYRFHHVEIKKNILTPNTMLTFVPHLRDLESSEEMKYNLWLKELEDIDLQSGFKPMSREDKVLLTVHSERAATISLYLESWLEELAIPGCNKTTLIRYMAQQEPDDAITPQQKTSLLKSHRDEEHAAPGADRAARIFTDAFRHVFKDRQEVLKRLELSNVLLLDESVDTIMDSKPTAKDSLSTQNDDEYDLLEKKDLATYCELGCVICFSHACEHGEYDAQNCHRVFSILSGRSRLSDVLKRRSGLRSTNGNDVPNGDDMSFSNCQRKCYLLRFDPNSDCDSPVKPWSEDERTVLRSLFLTANHSKVRKDPICLAAEFLDRACCEVYREFQSMQIVLPEPEPAETIRVRNVPWYDRHRKMLLGDWQDHTVSHVSEKILLPEPCCHNGPCAPGVCSCVDARVLCDRFCRCTVDDCAYKFTGCACQSLGKTCQAKQKDRPCICVQLNRECDPELCGSCGVLERADPANSTDDVLHSSGCQNCDLQRGSRKALLLGQSQLEGVGYGLFTAEDIAQDEFVVEYVGELITHDEGVRREARRGDVFDEEATVSYLFTLLDAEGIWVDAAVYGNLSRYINHALEGEKRGCNIAPRILYVNGEFRIKFTAMRDIKAGEELFFNYGKEFPNLTKQLLDDKAGAKEEPAKRKGGRPKRTEVKQTGAKHSKTDKAVQKKARGPRKKVADADVEADIEADTYIGEDGMMDEARDFADKSRKRKRRAMDDSDSEEYRPAGTDGTSRGASESDAETGKGLRKRASKQLRILEQQTKSPNGATPPVKTKGKRGGARPGSGRPRKYPRPPPKPTESTAPGGATPGLNGGPTGTSEVTKPRTEAAALAAAPAAAAPHGLATTAARGNDNTSTNISTTTVISPSGPTQTTAVVHTATSTIATSTTLSEDARNNNETTQSIFEVLDSDEDVGDSGGFDGGDADDDDDDDDDEDQDVVIRKRIERVPRNRRRPAKFRDDEVW